MGRKWLALAIQVPFAASLYLACGPGGGNGDGGPDSTAADVKPDIVKMPPDAGMMETSVCAPSTTIDSTQITWTPPSTPNPTACSDQQLQDLYTNCFSSTANMTTCQNWLKVTSNANCNKCLESTEGMGSTFSALINTSDNVVYLNIGGCIALVSGDTSMTGCGGLYWANTQCEVLACAPNCPVSGGNQAEFMAYTACETNSETAVCAPYANALCNFAPDGGPDAAAVYNACFAPLAAAGFASAFVPYGSLFCGGYPADAGVADSGSDAGADASADAMDDGG